MVYYQISQDGEKRKFQCDDFNLKFVATACSQPSGCHQLANSVNLMSGCVSGVKNVAIRSNDRIWRRGGNQERRVSEIQQE